MSSSKLRWVPAIAVPAVVIAGAVAIPQMANADVSLPHKSAAGIIALADKATKTSFSGTISQTANLGLPDISSSALGGGQSGSQASDLLSQLTGTHKANVFVDGSTKSRIQTLDDLAERDIVRNGNSVWTYDSKSNAAVHLTLPSHGAASRGSGSSLPDSGALPTAGATPQTPTALAKTFLSKIDKTTRVSTSSNVEIAGQKAYQITLTPKDTSTLVKNVSLAVDSKTGIPLRVVVHAVGQKAAAYSVQFTEITYSTPSASTFSFAAPKGATVKTLKAPAKPTGGMHPGGAAPGAVGKEKATAALAAAQPTVIGSGWSSILGVKLSTAAAGASGTEGNQLLDQVTTKVTGGRVVQTALLSAFLSDDGHVYIGAVSAKTLEAAVAAQK